jgi:hypothetical protein
VRTLLCFVEAKNFTVAACVAVNVAWPVPIIEIIPLLESIVATLEASDVYVIAPVLKLAGAVVIENDASPIFLSLATVKFDVENVLVPKTTVRMELIDASVYWSVAGWYAVIVVTESDVDLTTEIRPLAFTVATDVLLLLYVIVPPLELVTFAE